MEKRGAGLHSGEEDSARRVRTLEALRRALEGLHFPLSKAELLRLRGDSRRDLPIPEVGPVPLRAFVAPLNTVEFTSPMHVVEVVDIAWQDFADVYTLGAGATRPYDHFKPKRTKP